MQGVTTAIVAFLLVCIVYPNLVKNRTQYYMALACAVAVIVLDALAHLITGMAGFCYVMTALLQVVALLMLILSAGGLTMRELADDLAQSYEILRRGETEKTLVIPRSGQTPAARDEEPRTVYRIDEPAEKKPAADTTSSLPLE